MELVEFSLLFLAATSLLSFTRYKDITDKITGIFALYAGLLGIILDIIYYFFSEAMTLTKLLLSLYKFSLPVGGMIICEESVSVLKGKERKKEIIFSVFFNTVIYLGGIIFFFYKPVLFTLQHEQFSKFIGSSTLSITIYEIIVLIAVLSGVISLIPPIFKKRFWGVGGVVGLVILLNTFFINVSSKWASTVIYLGKVEFSYFAFSIFGSGILFLVKALSPYNQLLMSLRYKFELKDKIFYKRRGRKK